MPVRKIAVIGNACSGKTSLSRRLAAHSGLPLIHVDSIQFLPGLEWRDPQQTCEILAAYAADDEWIIDGLGPLRIIEDRLEKADKIIFIRLPLWRIHWWCLKRQVKGLFVRRPELPENCFESTYTQTRKLLTTIRNVHHGLWPQLDRILARDLYRGKVVYIRTVSQFERLAQSGF